MQFFTYYNGKRRRQDEAFIPLTDRSVYFGDGIYDACIARGGRVFMANEHIERFFSNARRMEIPLTYTKEEIASLLKEAAAAANGDCFLYFQLTARADCRSHALRDSSASNFLLTASDVSIPGCDNSLALIGVPDKRHLICDVKTLNLIVACEASRKALQRGADEAVFIRDGLVTECSHSNISIIKGGILRTHPADNLILPGISRAHMLRVAKSLHIKVIEEAFTENELRGADEVLVTSTSKICQRASRYEDTVYKLKSDSIGIKICSIMHEDFDKLTK